MVFFKFAKQKIISAGKSSDWRFVNPVINPSLRKRPKSKRKTPQKATKSYLSLENLAKFLQQSYVEKEQCRLFVLPPEYSKWRFFYHLSASWSKQSGILFRFICKTRASSGRLHFSVTIVYLCNEPLLTIDFLALDNSSWWN